MENKNEVIKLIGDFYEGHAYRNYYTMGSVIEKLEYMLLNNETDSEPFAEYFGDIYSGRSAYNTLINVSDYPVESVIREILQNTFDSYYNEKDIKVTINFKENGKISIAYNEIGFTLEQFLYYLSVGRNNGDYQREGRFGVGSKSVFMNVISLSMRSNSFRFHITNDHGILRIADIDLQAQRYRGTEIVLEVDSVQYERIYDNFCTLTSKRGTYINLVDLCFAFNRKKVLNIYGNTNETPDRTFNIAILNNGDLVTVYKINNYENPSLGRPNIRFSENGRSVVDFICHEKDGFVFLVPLAIASNRRREIIKLLLEKYNLFSTYELTGLLKSSSHEPTSDKLSAFFISVPNHYVTSYRTGIRHDSEHEVSMKVEEGLLDLMRANREFFVISLKENKKSPGKYYLRPDSYAFEFVKNFIFGSVFGKNLKYRFLEQVSLVLPNREDKISYDALAENSFICQTDNVSKEEHQNGSAYKRFIEQELLNMEQELVDVRDKVICVKYNWENDIKTESGTVFLYKFFFDDSVHLFESDPELNLSDFNLSHYFRSLAGKQLSELLLGDNTLPDDEAFARMFSILDKGYREDYSIKVQNYQFYISHKSENYIVDLSRMKIKNIKLVIDMLQGHQHRFNSYQNYSEAVDRCVDIFTEGKETYDFLKEIKACGGTVTLEMDFNSRYHFSAFGKQFMVPNKMTNTELVEIIEDVNILIKNGLLNGRVFDFPMQSTKYSFDARSVKEALQGEELSLGDISRLISSLYVSDLNIDRIAFLDSENTILEIADTATPIEEDVLEQVHKYVYLSANSKKSEFADVIEYILCGESSGRVKHKFLSAHDVNRVLADQLPHELKPMLTITKDEFRYLCDTARKIEPYKGESAYRNYFIKDVNYKIMGYGGACCACGYKTSVLNGFGLQDFKVGILDGNKEVIFNFSLFLCANDLASSKSWVIESISIGGMSPLLWLEEIKLADKIPPEFMLCNVRYREQLSYDLPGVDYDSQLDNVIFSPRRSIDVRLTPLMAAKWVEDNSAEDYN